MNSNSNSCLTFTAAVLLFHGLILGKKNNWQRNVKGKNKPIKNLDIIKKIRFYSDKYKIIFKHIKSHKMEPKNKNSLEYRDWYGNNMADKLARKGADK